MDSNLLNKLERQLHFLAEIDKAKQVVRNTLLLDKSRQENDAEHSWHMAVAAFYGNTPILKIWIW